MNSDRFTIVDEVKNADAVLKGAAGIVRRTDNEEDFAGTGLLRLVDTKSQRTIWAHEYKRGFMFGGSVSTRVANQMVKQLLKDAK